MKLLSVQNVKSAPGKHATRWGQFTVLAGVQEKGPCVKSPVSQWASRVLRNKIKIIFKCLFKISEIKMMKSI